MTREAWDTPFDELEMPGEASRISRRAMAQSRFLPRIRAVLHPSTAYLAGRGERSGPREALRPRLGAEVVANHGETMGKP